MVKHIVCFKMDSEENAIKAKEVLLSMIGKVPTAKKIEVGVDFLHSARSYDIILMVDLKDKSTLEEYQKDEYHCSVVKTFMHAHATSSVTVDYEF